jgi:hypothetical protein
MLAASRFTDQFMFLPGPLGLDALPTDAKADLLVAGANAPGAQAEVGGPPLPHPIALPPFKNAGPSVHPALPASCQAGQFFGVPLTQKKTKGKLLSPMEVTRRRADIAAAIGRARHQAALRQQSSALARQHGRSSQNASKAIP